MKELLFESVNEKEALENILALNQIKKCDKEIEKYTEEIKELNIEMKNILRDEEIEEEYVEKIEKYKRVLSNLDGDTGRIVELDEAIEFNENKIMELQADASDTEYAIESYKNEIFETSSSERIIECQNEIEIKTVLLNDINETINKLVSDNTPLLIEREYLLAKNSGSDFNIPNFNRNEIQADLERISKIFNEQLEKLSLPIRENIEFCQKKIKNRELEINKFNERKNNVINNYPNSIKFNVEEAYQTLKGLLNELGLCNGVIDSEEDADDLFEEHFKEEKEQPNVEVVKPLIASEDIKDEMVLLTEEEEPVMPELKEETQEKEEKVVEETTEETIIPEITEEKTEEQVVEVNNEEIAEVEKNEEVEETAENSDEVGSVSYVLSDGESLINIAEKIYPSKDNWEAIYYFNKEAIDNYLVSNGISNDFETIKELANDTTVFAGIKLEIPTDYNYKI